MGRKFLKDFGLPESTTFHHTVSEAPTYVFADLRDTGLNGTQFAGGRLDTAGVSVTPGEGFGPSGAGHVRITLGG